MKNPKNELEDLRKLTFLGGGEDRITAQHDKGKATARERIEKLLDPETFVETGMYITHRSSEPRLSNNHPYGDGVVTGWGKIDGRTVYLFAQDFTVMGGSVGEAHGHKIAQLLDLAE